MTNETNMTETNEIGVTDSSVPTDSQALAKVKKDKKQSREARWNDAFTRVNNALSYLRDLQKEYEGWYENLPNDINGAKIVEIATNTSGTVWVNIDGQCFLRVQNAEHVIIKDSVYGSRLVYVAPDSPAPL
jgi:hypothetical protein